MVDSSRLTEAKGSMVDLDSTEGQANSAVRANLEASRVHLVANLSQSVTTAIRWATGLESALKHLKSSKAHEAAALGATANFDFYLNDINFNVF
jgi:hypothetical protein